MTYLSVKSLRRYHDMRLLEPAHIGRFTGYRYYEPSGPPAWKTITSWAVIGTADKVIPPALLRSMALRAGAHITDVIAGHLSLISRSGTVTRVILEAASATR